MESFYKILVIITLTACSFTLNAQLFEDFEQGVKNYYALGQVALESGEWTFDDALIGTTSGDKKNGAKSARIRDGYIKMNFDYPNGVLEVSFYAANYGTDAAGAVQLSYSTDGGDTWTSLGNPIVLTSNLTQYTVSANVEGNIRLRFVKTAGNRINIDDVLISDYIQTVEEPTLAVNINGNPYENGSTFNFGINTGQASAMVKLRNVGIQDLVISSCDIIGDNFSVQGDVNVTLSTLETFTFSLLFESDIPGVTNGSITFNSNDPENGQFTIALTAETLDTSQPLPIGIARQLPEGTIVTVTGRVTVAHQFAGPVYFQDATGGIAWYNGAIMRDDWLVGAVIGDSIVVTGELGSFYSLLQLVNETYFEVFPESNAEVEPLELTLEQFNTGNYEAMLVQIGGVEFSTTGLFSGATNYTVTDPTGEGQIRIDNYTNIPGTNIPNGVCQITGVAGRFQSTHQLMPRFTSDIKDLSGPVIISVPPYEVSSTASSITFEWETELAGHSEIRYGTTSSLEIGAVIDEELKTQHSLTISGLTAATAYRVQLRSAIDADTSATMIYISSTGSPTGTMGTIETFFNKDVSHDLATYREADQNVDFSVKLMEFIQIAEETLEIAMYSISGCVGGDIADEIISAHNRGVDVRVIASGHTGIPNQVIDYLTAAGVRAVQSLGTEQMHNKFAVIDAHHSDPSKTWLITGSWNATDEGTYDQYQNMVIIQDVALARAYWYEFNQMWGAQSGSFNSSNARFGSSKTIVNPSVFWIGDDQTKVEVYFSPQANTEAQIIRTLNTAQSNIDLTLNLITRRSITSAMLSKFNQGIKVRGTIGSINIVGSEWEFLSSWADVHHFSQADFGLLHHKYAIFDGEATTSNSKVVTGSHNWSANANFSNDENTLIIHNPRVANEYFQEFGARYWQAGGQDEFNVSISGDIVKPVMPESSMLHQNFPNPFHSTTSIRFTLLHGQQVSLRVYDIMGREVAIPVKGERFDPGEHTVRFDASKFASGIYIYCLQLGDGRSFSKSMSVVK
jgi:hypothetical protein